MKSIKWFFAAALGSIAFIAGGATRIVQDQCGPFTDVSPTFCPYVLEMYYLGITAGTSATTFSPDNPVTRGQAAVFVSKAINQTLVRSSRRAALGQWWTTHAVGPLGLTPLASTPYRVASDGSDLWVAATDRVVRVHASDGRVVEEWTGASLATAVQVAMGRVFVAGLGGTLYMIDPSQAAGSVTTVASNLGPGAQDLAFDGSRLWSANNGGSVSIIVPAATPPWTVTTVSTGFSKPNGIVFDGSNVWVADGLAGSLFRLDGSANIVQTVKVGSYADFPAFDGANIFVPTAQPDNTVVVVRAADGALQATLSGNGLSGPEAVAFDGERILVVNGTTSSVSLWRAADLSPIGNFALPSGPPFAACSDGLNFWITIDGPTAELGRF